MCHCSELLYPVTVGEKLGWFAARTHAGEGQIRLTPVDADEPPVPHRMVKYRCVSLDLGEPHFVCVCVCVVCCMCPAARAYARGPR